MAMQYIERELAMTGDPRDSVRARVIKGIRLERGEDVDLPQPFSTSTELNRLDFNGVELRHWMAERGYTINNLASKLGVAARTISRWRDLTGKLPNHANLSLSFINATERYSYGFTVGLLSYVAEELEATRDPKDFDGAVVIRDILSARRKDIRYSSSQDQK